MAPHYLDRLFAPRSLAVFGASDREQSVGGRVLRNLVEGGFDGPIFPINPKHDTVLSRQCYRSIRQIGEQIDLAIIATPAAAVPGVMHECGERGIRLAVIHTAGVAEAREQTTGDTLQKALLAEARRFRMRFLGPNCLGVIRPSVKFNATFSKNTPQDGSLALVSQSGALCTAILDWAEAHAIGFSSMVSLGDATDIDFGELLDYLAIDPQTRGILLYIEGIRDARRFLSSLRVAARMKPVVVVKAGRHAEGSRAAITHTGALVGSDEVFDAALMRTGAVRVMRVEQLFAAAQLLATERHVSNNRLAIVTNAGGPGVLAVDRAIDLGIRLAALSADTMGALDRVLPASWSHANPVDIMGDADAARYRAATALCLEDPDADGVLAVLTPQAMTDPLAAAGAVVEARGKTDKPILACWMGESHVAAARAYLTEHGIPVFRNPEAAVEAFASLANYHRNQILLRQAPGAAAPQSDADRDGARLIVDAVLAERRSLLSGTEARAVLNAFGIPTMLALEADGATAALVAAESLGFPVVLKICSPGISHKSDVNGVRLNIRNAQAVQAVYHELIESVKRQRPDAHITGVTVERMYTRRDGRELNIGVVRDSVFGPAISIGLGGTAVEVLRDRAVSLPPLNPLIVRDQIDRIRASRMIGAFRGMPPVNKAALERVLMAVSEMVCELPQIVELDINPLIADPEGVTALDARIVVALQAPQLTRYAHMAIEPYPNHLVSRMQLTDGREIVLRPIRPEDSEMEAAFVRDLSPESKYFRFMQRLQELTPDMLLRFTQIDYDREMALIAVAVENGKEVEIAVARYGMNPDGESCEFAIVVADAWQNKGIGTRLATLLMEAAKARGFQIMEGDVLKANAAMLALVRHLGFSVEPAVDDPTLYHVVRTL